MANFETDVPEQIENLLRHLLNVGRNFAAILGMEQHHIDIAKWIQIATSISAKRDQSERRLRSRDRVGRGSENMLQDNVNELPAARADFAATAARLMFQSQAVLFEL